MDTTQILLIILATVGVTVLIAQRRRESIRDRYHRFDRARKLVYAAALVLIAWTFLSSGDPILIIAAIGLIASATIYFVVERPHETIV